MPHAFTHRARKSSLVVSLVAICAVSTGVHADTAHDNQPQSTGQNIKQDITQLMLTDKTFVKKAATANRAEVEQSQLALKASQDPVVRSFAQQMIKDHTAAGNELEKIARAKNIEVPVELDHSQKEAQDKLARLQGKEFDSAYREQMTKDHDKTVELFTAAADDKSIDPQFSALAAKLLPTLRQHQEHAHKLADTAAAAAR